jgi:hypothetical protein
MALMYVGLGQNIIKNYASIKFHQGVVLCQCSSRKIHNVMVYNLQHNPQLGRSEFFLLGFPPPIQVVPTVNYGIEPLVFLLSSFPK